MSTTTLDVILEKVASVDKDFRYMALSDLLKDLPNSAFKVEGDTERRLVQVVVHLLEDAAAEVSGLAVKCLALLVHKITTASMDRVLAQLSEKVCLPKKSAGRDMATLGLKAIIGEVGAAHAHAPLMVKVVTPKMLEGLQAADTFDVVSDSLDMSHELLARYGGAMPVEQHRQLQVALLPLLDDTRGGLRKRAISCLACLAEHQDEEELRKLADHILAQLQRKGLKPDTACMYIQLTGSVSRAVGYRFGAYLNTAVPLVGRFCSDAGEGEEELREACLQSLETFVSHSSAAARPHLATVLPLVLDSLSFDPNYAEDMDADKGAGDEDEADDEELSEEEYSDDEDVSWKVRRGGTKALAALLRAYPEMLAELYPQVAPSLRARFREREETVKADVFATFGVLLQQVAAAPENQAGLSPAEQLAADVPALLRVTARQLKEKSAKTRAGAFTVLRELLLALPGAVSGHVPLLLPGVLAALNDKSSSSTSLQTQALLFLRSAMAASDAPAAFQSSLPQLLPPVLAAVGERYYKVSAEGLRVVELVVHIMRPDPSKPIPSQLKGLLAPLHSAVSARLVAQDQDQEVKDAAIFAAAALVAGLGDLLTAQVPPLLKVLVERLKNEMTRLTAVKALAEVARSPLALPLEVALDPALPELTSFLRKANRLLRQASLAALQALVEACGGALDVVALDSAVAEAAELVSDGDLAITAAALQLATAVLQRQPASAPAVAQKVLPPALELVQSPLLQGAALEALQAFFTALPAAKPAGITVDTLLTALLQAGQAKGTSKAAQHSVAQCLAVLCMSSGPSQISTTVSALVKTLQVKGESETKQRLALLTLGGIGRCTDLSGSANVQSSITGALQSPASSEDVKGAAALALGGVAVGALAVYLPPLLASVAGRAGAPKEQYLLLRALNEVINSLLTLPDGGAQLQAAAGEQVLQLLLASTEAEEECRGVVAECLGHLALLSPDTVLPPLLATATALAAATRVTAVMAAKHMVLDAPHGVDTQLQAALPSFLLGLEDSDRHVRKAAVQTLSTAAHSKPGLLGGALRPLLPALYAATVVDESLIRTVDLGPFKHKIDDGLELRKAAFECMDVLLDQCPHFLQLDTFIQHLESGLQDHYDVKMPCHLLLAKLAAAAPQRSLEALPRLTAPLQRTLLAKVKSDAVKQEVDRNEDMLRSCLRACEAVSRIPGVASCEVWRSFMAREVLAPPPMKLRYQQVRDERQEADGGALDAMPL